MSLVGPAAALYALFVWWFSTGLILYAVQVNTGGDATSTMLQNCATDPSQFFLLTSADQIITTFNSIGTALSDLRISK